MTIKRGAEWGSREPIARGAIECRDDASAARALASGNPVVLSGGDMLRTLGGAGVGGSSAAHSEGFVRVPLDLLRVEVGSAVVHGLAHVVVRRRWWRGGVLRGTVVCAMNSQFLGSRDIAPRGHPNDGRVEVLTVAASMTVRQRVSAWSRARNGTHVPHPSITSASVSRVEVAEPGCRVLVDGVDVGAADHLVITVVADAGLAWFH